MIITPHGNLVDVNKFNEYYIKGLLLSTESNLHLEFFNPYYYYVNSRILKYLSKYIYIVRFHISFRTPLNSRIDSVFFFRTATLNKSDNCFSVYYARNIYNVYYYGTKAY